MKKVAVCVLAGAFCLLLAVGPGFALSEEEAAHHSADAAEATSHGGEGEHHVSVGIPFFVAIVNFALFVYLLIRFGKQPIRNYLHNRSASYAQALASARKMEEETAKLAAEYRERLARVEEETRKILDQAEQEADRRKEAIIEGARKSAERMMADAKMAIDNETQRAREEIRAELANEAVKIAEDLILKNMNAQDKDELNKRYLDNLEEIP